MGGTFHHEFLAWPDPDPDPGDRCLTRDAKSIRRRQQNYADFSTLV